MVPAYFRVSFAQGGGCTHSQLSAMDAEGKALDAPKGEGGEALARKKLGAGSEDATAGDFAPPTRSLWSRYPLVRLRD